MSRARAQTLSSVSSASSRSSPSIPAVPIIATPVPRRSKSVHSEQRQSIEQTGSPTKDSRSIDTALPEELRQIAHAQADRIEELSACIVRLTQSHTSEKHALERRVNLLERELGRKEKEIQGLTWLVRSDKSPISESASKSSPSLDSPMLDGAIQLPIIKLPTIRRIDAGYGTDTPDSSGNESNYSTRTTRAKRSSKILHSGRTLRPSPESPLPALPPSLDRRASSSSLASSRSAASSTSSLPLALASPLPPQLTSIPERAPPVPRLPSSSLHDPAIIAALNSRREKEMRRASVRTLPATPVQKAAPAPTPAAAYAANLMQGRKPTISQLLDDAPIPPTSRPSVSQ
ncbi:hypothetical protein CYLTODRAFT_117202 [Cylindrobasidium torrendii FP15055 ss-10]|uniref:Uncharacterized protein n=1 Tax=Cylindrobasidium torrendii FP15055 ss-10 TaxID=1314674 RepID=A0A0D7BLT1_9AGAR|nr:hypothetical protein CYLTODRAFT_117202 [Cylindrobasidium torrendii FP15055 ss-10]